MDKLYNDAIKMHQDAKGKITVNSKVKVNNKEDLSMAYSPGVAAPCLEIKNNFSRIYDLTSKGNLVAVVSDGSAVLGLGDIGPHAALPVMEGKAVLFKEFGNVDAFPICLNTNDSEKIIETCKLLEPSIGGINLEDISAPRCFEIEKRLKQELSIPVFHDDQHGTAIVCLAGIINSCKLVNKSIESLKVVVFGTGAAGLSIINLLYDVGIRNIVAYNNYGVVNDTNISLNDEYVKELFNTNRICNASNTLEDLFIGADVFIGVSAANLVTTDMVKNMGDKPIIFAMANPTPEIDPNLAKEAGAYIVGTGRSDFPNQVNNVLAFPGIFRGALDARTSQITEEMKIAAARAIASIIKEEELNPDYIIPSPFNKEVAKVVSKAVYDLAKKGVGYD